MWLLLFRVGAQSRRAQLGLESQQGSQQGNLLGPECGKGEKEENSEHLCRSRWDDLTALGGAAWVFLLGSGIQELQRV